MSRMPSRPSDKETAMPVPGRTGDLAYGLGSLHWANFPYQAASYRVTG
ncbi:hypothetical protein [Kitasatospora griseola]